jgi:hypothetical protein
MGGQGTPRTSPEFWLNLQSLYESPLAEQRKGKTIKALPTLPAAPRAFDGSLIWSQETAGEQRGLPNAQSSARSLVSSRERQIRLTTACRAEVMSSPGCQVR